MDVSACTGQQDGQQCPARGGCLRWYLHRGAEAGKIRSEWQSTTSFKWNEDGTCDYRIAEDDYG